MEDWIIEKIENSLKSVDTDIASVETILKEDWFVAGNEWYDFAVGLQGVITPVALTIVTICFLLEFLKITIQMDILKWEYGLRCFFKLAFAKVCIEVAIPLLSAIYTTGAVWISKVGTSVPNVGEKVWDLIGTDITNSNMLALVGMWLSTGITFTAINIIVIIIQVMAWARKFEICIMVSIAPLPCAFLPLEDGGSSRIPKKYFFGFASTCLAGLFMMMSIKLYGVLASGFITDKISTLSDIGSIASQLLLATLILVIAVIKSGSWASKILDVA